MPGEENWKVKTRATGVQLAPLKAGLLSDFAVPSCKVAGECRRGHWLGEEAVMEMRLLFGRRRGRCQACRQGQAFDLAECGSRSQRELRSDAGGRVQAAAPGTSPWEARTQAEAGGGRGGTPGKRSASCRRKALPDSRGAVENRLRQIRATRVPEAQVAPTSDIRMSAADLGIGVDLKLQVTSTGRYS